MSLMLSGTPWAMPDADPKLDRMSLRTTPLWVRTSGPFDPSPGYGPPVSSGIVSQPAALAVVGLPVAVADADDEELWPGPQPTSANRPALRPAYPMSLSIRRRSSRVSRSKAR